MDIRHPNTKFNKTEFPIAVKNEWLDVDHCLDDVDECIGQ